MLPLKRALLKLATAAALAVAASGVAGGTAAASDLTFAQLDYDQYAVDGSDFYWLRSSARNRFGCPSRTQLLRRDLLGGSTKVIAKFSTSCEVEVGWPEAGGGRVAVERFTDKVFDGYDTKLFSMNRNGGARRVLAAGSMRGDSILDRPKAACGRSVRLMSATPDGAFVVAKFTQTSTVKRCGDARNQTTSLYETVTSDGSRRKVFSSTDKLPVASGRPPLEEAWVNGGFAALVRSETRRVLWVNLSSGVVTGPLVDSASQVREKIVSMDVSVGPAGQVLINVPRSKPISPPAYMTTDLFSNPNDPFAVVRKDRDGPTWFCGSRVISSTAVNPEDEFDSLVELNPATLNTESVIARVDSGSDIEGCSAKAVTLSSELIGGKTRVYAVALPG